MKTTLLIATLFFCLLGVAQKSKTIEMSSAGTLSAAFTQNELDSVNKLTITGPVNYLDLRYLDNQLDKLDTLNLLDAEVVEYVQPISAWENKYFYANSVHTQTFAQNLTLKLVILPKNLLRIEESAFANCPFLHSVVLPSSVKQIYSSAFANCPNLALIDPEFPDKLEILGPNAFYNTAWLNAQELGAVYVKDILYVWKGEMSSNTELVLKDSLRFVVDSAFVNAQNLVGLTVPANTGRIGTGAFAGCGNLQSLTLEGVVPMGTGVFEGCNAIQKLKVHTAITYLSTLKELSILSNVQELVLTGEMNAVDFRIIRENMPALSILDLKGVDIKGYYGADGTVAQTKGYPDGELPTNALYAGWPAPENSTLKTLILPDSLLSVGVNACSSMIELESIYIPSKVETIDVYAFYNCRKLTTVNFPEGLKRIHSAAFVTTNISEFTLPASLESLSGSAFNNTPWYNAQPDGMIYLRDDIAYRLKGEVPVGTDIVVRDGIRILAESTFNGLASANIASVTLPNTLEVIGGNAFMMCSELKSLKLPSSVKYIGVSAFDGCTNLETINLPKAMEFIGDMAFYNCTGLDSIFVFASNPLAIESTTFWNANNNNCILYVPRGSVNAYSNWSAMGWNSFTNIREMPDWVISSVAATKSGNFQFEIYTQGNQIVVKCFDASSLKPHASGSLPQAYSYVPVPFIRVFHISGVEMHETTSRDADLHIFPVSQKGVYIVKVNDSTRKIVVD